MSRQPGYEEWDALTGALSYLQTAPALLAEAGDTRPRLDARNGEVSIVGGRRREPLLVVPGCEPVGWSADRTMFFAGALEGSGLKVWRVDGTLVASLRFPKSASVVRAHFVEDDSALLGGLTDGSLACWDVATAALRWSTQRHGAAVVALEAPTGDGPICSLGEDDRLCLTSPDGSPRWEAFLGRAVIRDRPEGSRAVISPSGALVVVARPARALRVFDAASGEERSLIDGHDGSVMCVAVSRDGRLVASGGTDREVHVVDVEAGLRAWTLETLGDAMDSVEFLPDRPALRVVGTTGAVQRWSLVTGMLEEQVALDDRQQVRAHGARDGSRLLVEHTGGLEVWSDGSAERVLWSVDVSGAPLRPAGFDDRRGRVLACRSDGNWPDVGYELEAYDAGNGRRLGVVRRLGGRCLALTETYDGLVSVVPDGDDLVVTEEWGELRTGRVRQPTGGINRLALSADGARMVGSNARLVVVWELGASPREVARVDFAQASDRVTAIALSADGSTLAIGTARGCVLVYAIDAMD